MRPIDADALGIGRCNPDAFPLDYRAYCAGWNGVIGLIEQAPTIDAVPVVRCKDCKHYGIDHDCFYHSADEGGTPIFVRDNDFCSYGERKDNETHH